MGQTENLFLNLIEEKSGLIVNTSHKKFLENYIADRCKALGLSIEEYAAFVRSNENELEKLIDEAAINETYFFREERQFDFLQKYLRSLPKEKKYTVWSAACSSGEEALSLYSLFEAEKRNVKLVASDIDKSAMAVLQKGFYTRHSLRSDGQKFHTFLEGIGSIDEKGFTVKKEILQKIDIQTYNLISDSPLPVIQGSVDILFLRNVFIYFNSKVRAEIIKRIAAALREGGLLFLSVNEIASVDCDFSIPLIKENSNGVYYFRKKSDKEETHVQKRRSLYIEAKTKGLEYKKKKAIVFQKKVQEVKEIKNLDALLDTFFDLYDKKNFLDANKLLQEFFFRPDQIEYKLYLLGLLAEGDDKGAEAEKFFFQSSISNSLFWPGLFKLGLLYEKKGEREKAKKTFANCQTILETYIQKGNMCYNKIVQTFSPTYFLRLCQKFSKREE